MEHLLRATRIGNECRRIAFLLSRYCGDPRRGCCALDPACHASTHPILRARYADLAWDMSRAIAEASPNPEMARVAIDAYIESFVRQRRNDVHDEFEALI